MVMGNNLSEHRLAHALFGRIDSLASEIARDEQAIKEALIKALEEGRVDFALKVLREWSRSAPRDVVCRFLEASDVECN